MDLEYRNLFNNATRTYNLVPKDVGKFLALSKGGSEQYNLCKFLFNENSFPQDKLCIIFAENLLQEKFHLRTQHSVLLGYWTTELGGLNQVVHLWQYGQSNTY